MSINSTASTDATTLHLSVTDEQVQAALEHLEMAAGMFEPGGQLCEMRDADELLACDEALGSLIRLMHPTEAFYAAVELRNAREPSSTPWLNLRVPGHKDEEDGRG